MDERAVSLGFLGVLRVLAQARPVLVAVDDLQWLDHASTRVLLFAARRLAERVGFLLAMPRRRAAGSRSRRSRCSRITPSSGVEPLGLEDVHAIVQQRLGLSLSRPTLRSVHETSAGNPFFALELARASGGGRREPHVDAARAGQVRGRAALPAEDQGARSRRRPRWPSERLDLVGACRSVREADEALCGGIGAGRSSASATAGSDSAHPLLAAAAYASAGTRVRDLHTVLAGLVRRGRRTCAAPGARSAWAGCRRRCGTRRSGQARQGSRRADRGCRGGSSRRRGLSRRRMIPQPPGAPSRRRGATSRPATARRARALPGRRAAGAGGRRAGGGVDRARRASGRTTTTSSAAVELLEAGDRSGRGGSRASPERRTSSSPATSSACRERLPEAVDPRARSGCDRAGHRRRSSCSRLRSASQLVERGDGRAAARRPRRSPLRWLSATRARRRG